MREYISTIKYISQHIIASLGPTRIILDVDGLKLDSSTGLVRR
jgi:hypothetical protein